MTSSSELPQVPEIDVVSAWQRVRDETSYILDVREPHELADISVPGAIHVPLNLLPSQALSLPSDRELLVICHSGIRSAYATQFLLNAGFAGTKNVAGGVIAWAQAQLPYLSRGTTFNSSS